MWRREPFADALRTAREIVTEEGCALGAAARIGDEAAFERAAEALARRIAQVLLEWSEEIPADAPEFHALEEVRILGTPTLHLDCMKPK